MSAAARPTAGWSISLDDLCVFCLRPDLADICLFIRNFSLELVNVSFSRVESPEAGLIPSEYSKFPHQRTQSMDSMSSGHSSGDHVLGLIPTNNAETTKQQQRGRVTGKPTVVVPFDDQPDQDETSVYLAYVYILLSFVSLSNVSIRIDKIVAAGRYEEITLGDVGTSDSKRKSNIPLPGRNSRFVAVVNAWRLAICLFLSLVVFQSAFVVAQALMDAPDLNALRWLQQRAQDLTGSH